MRGVSGFWRNYNKVCEVSEVDKVSSGAKKQLSLSAENKTDVIRLALMALAILLSLLDVWKIAAPIDFISLFATVVGGYPMVKEALEAVRERKMTMELSMSIAVLATLLIGQFLTGLVITFFVLFAELIEQLTVNSGRTAIRELIDFMPHEAVVRRNGKEEETDIDKITPGETVIVKPGGRIPVDGVVVKGSSFVDESSITGESLPVEKSDGHRVYAGTINQSGVLDVKATSVGKNTAFGRIIEAIEAAEKSKAPIHRVADRLAAWLVYFALAGAAITFLYNYSIVSAISALIVAGACGVAAGTPLAILAGIGRSAKKGIIVKGGIHLEQLAHVDTVVLDKTGTLTLGSPKIVEVLTLNGVSEKEVVRLAATAEQHSEHPIARAILNESRRLNLQASYYSGINNIPGKGIICRSDGTEILVGNESLLKENSVEINTDVSDYIAQRREKGETIILVATAGCAVGAISVADVLRSDSVEAVTDLKRHGLKVILLSGDSVRASKAVAQSLSVDEVYGQMLPAAKVQKIRGLMRSGRRVAMVGDGINDAAAMVESSVGIAMGGGTDIAVESAGMVLTTNSLSKIVEAIMISRQCFRVIMFNFWGTILVDTTGILLAFFSVINPLAAALIHVGSELGFILNSARLFRKGSWMRGSFKMK